MVPEEGRVGAKASDEDLLRRFQAGDREALGTLLERYTDLLTRHAAGQLPQALRRRVSVADVIQEAGIVAHRRHGDFEDRGEGSFRNWLMRIVDLKVKEAVRAHAGVARRAIGREIPKRTDVRTAHFVSRQPSPSQVAMGGELQALARDVMASLPPDYREVLRLAREQGMTLRQVAECMGRSRDAVKKLYGRALSRFTDELERRRRDPRA